MSRNVTTALSQNCPRRLLRRPSNRHARCHTNRLLEVVIQSVPLIVGHLTTQTQVSEHSLQRCRRARSKSQAKIPDQLHIERLWIRCNSVFRVHQIDRASGCNLHRDEILPPDEAQPGSLERHFDRARESLRIEPANAQENVHLVSEGVADPHEPGNGVLEISAPKLSCEARPFQGLIDSRPLHYASRDDEIGIETRTPGTVKRSGERTNHRVFNRTGRKYIDNIQKELGGLAGATRSHLARPR